MANAKRKAFWIDTPLQLRVVGFIVAVIALTLAMAYFGMDRGLELAAQDPPRIYISVDWARNAMRPYFTLVAAITLMGGFLLSVVWSHRMIGPLLVLTAGLRRLREGDLSGEERLRATDSFKGLLDELSKTRDGLRKLVAEDRKVAAEIESRLSHLAEKGRLPREVSEEIKEIQQDLQKITASFKT